MKRIFPQIAICTLMFLFSNCGSGEKFKHGDIVSTNKECLSASSSDNFSELNRVCNRKDEEALKAMIASEDAYVLPGNTRIEIKELSFGKIEGEIQGGAYDGVYVVVSSEFVSK